MEKYLVTGGAGFIGSHLVDRLIQQGNKVIVLDDLSSGFISNVNSKSIFVEGSITNVDLVASLMKKVDFCYHLAAIASVQQSIVDWLDSHDVNLTGTINIFNEASKHNIPVIYASSAAVYGEQKLFPIAETATINLESPYGASKYFCERQAKLFGSIKGLKNIGMRFFNVYGPRQNPSSPYSGVISIFMDKIKKGETIQIFGDGNQERDFIFVQDIVTSLIKSQNFVSSESEIYNICNNKPTSINQLVQILEQIFNKPIEINYAPARKGDITKSVGSCNKINRILSFNNHTTILEGLLGLKEAGL